MRKKILIGSTLVLTLLLLMPSIPAIQQKTIEEGIKQDIQEKLETINVNDLKDIKVLDWIRHPILYIIVMLQLKFRFLRLQILEFLEIMCFYYLGFDYLGFIFLERWLMLFVTSSIIADFWGTLSDNLGWGWEF